ncbi:spore germination protein, partial [Mesorhizobium sp. M00.F.Ca.ET.186.01.1.1]
ITKSESEATVLGPQDSFVEMLEINLSLLRRRLTTPNLKIVAYTIGTETQNRVAVLYLENIANEINVERVKTRIQNVEYQGLSSSICFKTGNPTKP